METKSTNDGEKTFTHTGIRIMQAENGDLLFCDPGLVTGVRDSLMITAEIRKFKPSLIGPLIMDYIERHGKAMKGPRVDETFTFNKPSHE